MNKEKRKKVLSTGKSWKKTIKREKKELKHHAEKDILAVHRRKHLEGRGLNADEIFEQLKIMDFENWAKRFRYYAQVGKGIPDIKRWVDRCFNWYLLQPIALLVAAVYFSVGLLNNVEIYSLLLYSFESILGVSY